MTADHRLRLSLALLRAGVFVVMFVWTLDKLLRPEHAVSVFQRYYFLSGIGTGVMFALGVVELLLIVAFLAGLAKRVTYAAVLVLHAASTLASVPKYLAPFEGPNLLFFAAWPMLAACIALYLLRDADTLWVVAARPDSRT